MNEEIGKEKRENKEIRKEEERRGEWEGSKREMGVQDKMTGQTNKGNDKRKSVSRGKQEN